MSALCHKRTWANIDLACVDCRHVPLVGPLFQHRRTVLTRQLSHARTNRPYPQIDNCRPRRTTRFERNGPTGVQTSLVQSYAHHTAGTHLLLLYSRTNSSTFAFIRLLKSNRQAKTAYQGKQCCSRVLLEGADQRYRRSACLSPDGRG